MNYIKNVGFPLHQNQQTYRGDQNLGKFGSVFFRYTDANYTNQGSYNSATWFMDTRSTCNSKRAGRFRTLSISVSRR